MQQSRYFAIATVWAATTMLWGGQILRAVGQVTPVNSSTPILSDVNVDLSSSGLTGTLQINGETVRIEPNQTLMGPGGITITTNGPNLSINSSSPIQFDSSTILSLTNGGAININAPNFTLINSPPISNGGNITLTPNSLSSPALNTSGGNISIATNNLSLPTVNNSSLNAAGELSLSAGSIILVSDFSLQPSLSNPGFLAEQQLTSFFEDGDQLLRDNLRQTDYYFLLSPSQLFVINDNVLLQEADLRKLESGL